MARTVVLSNSYDYYADGEVVAREWPLLDGSIGAEWSSIAAKMETRSDHGRVATQLEGQQWTIQYRPPIVHAPSGIARVDFQYEPLQAPFDGRVEGAPLLYVDVGATPESTSYSGYGFMISANFGPDTLHMQFTNAAVNDEETMAEPDTFVVERPDEVLRWYTAQIEWDSERGHVGFEVLSDMGERVQSWSSTIHPTRVPFKHLESGCFHNGVDPTPGNPIRVITDNVYLAVETDEPTPTPTIEAVTRLYPRDDGRGLSSAARIYPPTKANRIVGGYR